MIDLRQGDCLGLIKEVPKVKLLLTDIPYGEVSRKDNGLRNLNKGVADVLTFDIQLFLETIYNKADIFIIFCGKGQFSEIYNFFADKKRDGTTRPIVWAKSNPSPMNGEYVYLEGTEFAVWFKKKGTGKLNCKCKKNYFTHPTGSSKHHPTEKNHKLLEELILDNTTEGDTVLDTCMGSGSTGIVAIQNNRNFIGIELDETYFNIAKERIEHLQQENRWSDLE